MRYNRLMMLLALAGGLAFASACGGGGKDDTDAGDDDDDSPVGDDDDDTADTSVGGGGYDTGILYWAFIGEGNRGGDGSYTGTEAYWLFGFPNQQVLCEFTYDATGSAATAAMPCSDVDGNACAFTLDVTLDNGVETAGDCASLFGGPLPTDGGSYTYGHTDNYFYYGTDYGPAIMYYYNGTYNGVTYTGWYWAGFSEFDSATGDWSYEWPVGYYIYYL